MGIVFLGSTQFSASILLSLLEHNYPIAMVFAIPKHFNISYRQGLVKNYNYSDISRLAKNFKIPSHEVDSIQGSRLEDYYEEIRGISPTVILVMGWYYKVTKRIRDLATYGAWGIHASLLPDYAGGAPLVWAMINGERETGVTLFKLDEGVDDGDIIGQETFAIEYDDTIKEVYEKATTASKSLLMRSLSNIIRLKFTPQDKSRITVYPQRTPEDGEIDFTKSAIELYNFIRAQSAPYPGAFVRTADGKKLIIEKARIE